MPIDYLGALADKRLEWLAQSIDLPAGVEDLVGELVDHELQEQVLRAVQGIGWESVC